MPDQYRLCKEMNEPKSVLRSGSPIHRVVSRLCRA